ncbi:hypothetical protein TNCV_3016461 [Trichonephila clavipes]|nr:hypothetical protein TNCV_3016461 [Trichonephila clavipes]
MNPFSEKLYNCVQSRKRLTSFMTLSFEGKIVSPQDAAANVKTDSNLKALCLACQISAQIVLSFDLRGAEQNRPLFSCSCLQQSIREAPSG